MANNKQAGRLDRLGRKLSTWPRQQLVLASIAALLLFVLISAPIVGKSSRALAEGMGLVRVPTARLANSGDGAFPGRLADATGLAYTTFFNLGLSKINFISHYTENRPKDHPSFEYVYWELWVRDNFDFPAAKKLFEETIVERIDGVDLYSSQFDAKTFEIVLTLDGLETHRVIFSKTSVEVEADATKLALSDVDRQMQQLQYAGPARIAIIIDDIGFRGEVERRFLDLPARITFAILPYAPEAQQFAEEANRRGREVMLHVPMQPKDYPNISPGKGGLLLKMRQSEILRILTADLAQIPHIVGVNNHMGSAFTSNPKLMRLVLREIKKHNLYFVDSRTAGTARGYEVAQELGMPSAMRNVFLDHVPTLDVIAKQFDLLVAVAKKKGSAIAIGHPHAATLQTLQNKLGELRAHNIVVVPPSELVH
jgi:polysaccharide deacetylase 2 family uncharacterized protein YibQ